MTLTALIAVTLAPGRWAWPGAALPIPRAPRPLASAPGAHPSARAPPAWQHWAARLQKHRPTGAKRGAGVSDGKSQKYSARPHSLPRNSVLYFSSSCLVLRCGKGEKHKGKSVIAFLGGRQNSAERRLVAKLSRDGKSVLFPSLMFVLIGTLKPHSTCQIAKVTQDNL